MQPYPYLQQVAAVVDTIDDGERIERLLDELEYLFDALEPELQPLCSDLIARLMQRREECR